MEQENKIFDEYEVECNTCERYWDSSCDGVKCSKDGTESRQCTSYKAVRKMDIVKTVEQHTKEIKSLDRFQIYMMILFVAHLLIEIFGK